MTEDEKNKLMTTTAPAPYADEDDDGLSSFSLEQLGGKASAFDGARILKFDHGSYRTTDGEVITAEREFYLHRLVKMVQKFVHGKLDREKSYVVPPKDDFPDFEKLNAAAPQEEWSTNQWGARQGPFVRSTALILIDVNTLDQYVFITNTYGGDMAIGAITNKIKLIRRLYGRNRTLIVFLEHGVRFTSKKNPQGIQRPSFHYLRHVPLIGDREKEVAQLSAPTSEPAPEPTRPSMTTNEQLNTFAGESDTPKKEPDTRRYSFLDPPTEEKRPSLKDDMKGDEQPF